MRIVGRMLALGGAAAMALVLAGAGSSASVAPGQLFAGTLPASLGGGVIFDVVSSPDATATAKLTIYVPAGYGLDTSAGPGTLIGSFFAVYSTKSVVLDYALGTVRAGDPSDPAAQACAPGPHAAVWLVTFNAVTEPTTIRFYVDPTTGAEASLGAYKLVACLPSPYVPVEQGGAPDGLTYQDLELEVSKKGGSIFTVPSKGSFTWRVLVTPYVSGSATLDAAATFEARTRVLVPYVLTEHARFEPKTHTVLVTGRLTAVGKPRARVRLTFTAGAPKAQVLVFWGGTRTRSDGSYSLRRHVRLHSSARKLQIFVTGDGQEELCLAPSPAPAGCVDENVSPPWDHSVTITLPKLRKHG